MQLDSDSREVARPVVAAVEIVNVCKSCGLMVVTMFVEYDMV